MILKPKLFTTLSGYSTKQFFSDAVAGLIVGIVAIPLAIAFAIASGVSPNKGLFTAVIAGFMISALGGSRVQIGGPTGAFVVVVYAIVQQYGIEGLVIATFMAGFILIAMGYCRLGALIKFIPHSVVVGFTSGIAVVIFSSQVKDFLGLRIEKVPVEFIEKWRMFFENLGSVNSFAFLAAFLTVLLIAVWPRVSRKVPGSLVALVLISALASTFHWPLETIGTRFGELPHTLPRPQIPMIDLSTVVHLLRPAFTIALLGAIESLLSAVVSDGMIGGKHRSNMELIAQGAANVGSALFGGMPATGAIARTVTNIKNGGRTPIAGMIHSLTVLLAMLFFGRWLRQVPLACLAGILVVVAYHMSEWRSFVELLKGPRGRILVLLVTFTVTVLVDLTVAIGLGVVLSAFLFVKRMSAAQTVRLIRSEMKNDAAEELPLMDFDLPKGVEIYAVEGPLFFGAAHQFEEVDRVVSNKPKVRILLFKNVPFVDATGSRALKSFNDKCLKNGIRLMIAGPTTQPLGGRLESDLIRWIGKENVFTDIKNALRRIS